ncbi:DUF2752 domain-containing protein [Pedobacter sp. JY14-1]|uniref:DUF2752 domain-containing protein n=1 Tax=Pedobacter sp. JY14-1 TaxID=3034151 RepID=UPI0023E20BAD|nr:DUF2752 domain-containing protein [Pedobacter sp. JY14-1]
MICIMSVFSHDREKADIFLLPCPFKYLTGLDCPGCGFQRSVIALMRGDVNSSLTLYPPAIPLILTFVFFLFVKLRGKVIRPAVINILFIVNAAVITTSYLFKVAAMLN